MSQLAQGRDDTTPTSYYNADEVESACLNFAAQYPGLATAIDLPEPTRAGRRCHALRLRAPAATAPRPAFMVIGGLHACEWGSSEITLHLAADLLHACAHGIDLDYGAGITFTAAQLTQLLQTTDIVLFPLVNPDGRIYSQTEDGYWRKNRSFAHPGAQGDGVGVDLNRNFDFLFDLARVFAPGTGVSASSDPASRCYQGPYPFSEPETRNVRWLVEQHQDLRWFADLHSCAQDVIFPWGDDESQHVDDQMHFANTAFDGQRGLPADRYSEYLPAGDRQQLWRLATRYVAVASMVAGSGYGVSSGFKFTPSCGTSHDWVFSRHRLDTRLTPTIAVAIEWYGGEAQPTWLQMLQIIPEVCAGLLATMLDARGIP